MLFEYACTTVTVIATVVVTGITVSVVVGKLLWKFEMSVVFWF
jgi:hypothetical protein